MQLKTQHTKTTTVMRGSSLFFHRNLTLLCLLLGLTLLSMGAAAQVDLQGSYRLRTQTNQAHGDLEQYQLDTSLTPGNRLRHQLILDLKGSVHQSWRVAGYMNTALSLSDSFWLQLQKANTALFIGTRAVDAPAIGLLNWSRLLTGAQLQTSTAQQHLGLQLAVGVPLGIQATLQLPGIGRVGPYLLPAQHLPLVTHSERVYVDGLLMQRKLDYVIDYELGSITFMVLVPVGSLINVEYAYEAAQPRLTTVALGRWQEERMQVDFALGQERALTAFPGRDLAADPFGGADMPSTQHMLGVGLLWQPHAQLQLTGSWLNTIAVWADTDRQTQVAAAQLGGQWQTNRGRAGWDYRFVPQGYAPLGATPVLQGYRELSAGYDVQLTPKWYSKLNVFQRTNLPIESDPVGSVQQKAEHVLTYVHGHHTLGWLIGMDGQAGAGKPHRLLSTGILATSSWGAWQLEAEQRHFLGSTTPQPGDTHHRSRLVLTRADVAPLRGTLQWKQETNLADDLMGRERLSVWQFTLASPSNSTAGTLVQPHLAHWQVQGLYNTVEQQLQPGDTVRTEVGYLQAHATLPLTARLAGQVWGEIRQQQDEADSRWSSYAEAVLHYTDAVQGSGYAWVQNEVSTHLPALTQYAAGFQGDVPLRADWTYTALFDVAQDSIAEQVGRGWRQVHGLRWQRHQWQVSTAWTNGLLELPLRPSAADKEQDAMRRPIDDLPVGQRLGVRTEFNTPATQASLYVARDWETASKGWQVQAEAATKVGRNNLSAQVSRTQHRGAQQWSVKESGVVAAQWELNQRLTTELKGRGDRWRTSGGRDDYEAIGIYSDWIVRF